MDGKEERGRLSLEKKESSMNAAEFGFPA